MANSVRLIRSAALSRSVPYAYASVVPSGTTLVFLAGACPLNLDGTTAGVGDYTTQTRKALENLQLALDAAGAALADVASTRVLVASADRADLGTVWSIVEEFFGAHDVPSTLLGVTVLGYPDQLVEIEATAAILDPIIAGNVAITSESRSSREEENNSVR